MRHPTRLKSAVSSSPHDSQETTRRDEDIERSSVVDDLNCHTQPSHVLPLTSRCQMWLHVAYGV